MKLRRNNSSLTTYSNHVELEESKPSPSAPVMTKSPIKVVVEPPVKLDVSHWDANNKFESYLKEHHLDPMKLNPIKNHVEHRLKPEKHHHRHHIDKNGNSEVNNVDYDTPL